VGGARWGSGVAFSAKREAGRGVLKTPFSFDHGPSELVSYDLNGSEDPPTGRHAITDFIGLGIRDGLLPDSSRLALFSGDMLSVYDLPSWKLVAAQRLGSFPNQGVTAADVFSTAITSHLQGQPDGPEASSGGTSILEFDLAHKRSSKTGHLPTQAYMLRWDATRGRILAVIRQNGESQLALCEARTGAMLKVLTEWGPHYPVASFMGDGRILSAERGDAQSFLRLFSSEGELLRTCPLVPRASRWRGQRYREARLFSKPGNAGRS